MRFVGRPSNPLEALALALNLAPVPLLETQVAFTTARAIQAGCQLGLYAALEGGPETSDTVASRCQTDPRATKLLLDALVGAGYLTYARRSRRYGLTKMARRWLLPDAPQSLHDKLLFQQLEWKFVGELERYVKTGKPLDIHARADDEMWEAYQRGMRSLGRMVAGELAKISPVPPGAREMLDIGGSAGVLSAALCRRHPQLRSTILDLPSAIDQAAPLLAEENMGDRVRHEKGNALSDDLGVERYDFVLLANLAHHFTSEENGALTKRVARALKPGGVFVVHELIRAEEPKRGDQVGTSISLYFGLTSQSGCWSIGEIAGWQRAAGLKVLPARRYRTAPGTAQQPARRT